MTSQPISPQIAEPHVVGLGGLMGNLQSLEFVIRVFLGHLPGALPHPVPHGTDVYTLPVGTKLPVSELTDDCSLGKLIEKFNVEMAARRAPLMDATLVNLRDALAHGRVSAAMQGDTLRLLKFSRPDRRGMVTITFNESMTAEWFTTQKKRVREAMLLVVKEAPAKAAAKYFPTNP